MIVKFLKNKTEEIKALEYSKPNIQRIIDICLDIRNEVNKVESFDGKRKFINFDLRLSTEPFMFLMSHDDHSDDVDKYWNDHKDELIFDLKILIRQIGRQ